MSTWNRADLLNKGWVEDGQGVWHPPGSSKSFAAIAAPGRTGREKVWIAEDPLPKPTVQQVMKMATETGIILMESIPERNTWEAITHGLDSIALPIVPIGKPRMVKSDSYKKRPRVERYWIFKDALKALATRMKVEVKGKLIIEFHMPIAKSLGQKKRYEMNGTPHLQKPDCDNMVKAVQDCLLIKDEGIYEVHARKIWSLNSQIIIWQHAKI